MILLCTYIYVEDQFLLYQQCIARSLYDLINVKIKAHALDIPLFFSLVSTFYLSTTLIDSIDINECSVYGTCSQVCLNTRGSFTCKCVPGYEMVEDPTKGRTCKAIGTYISCSALKHAQSPLHNSTAVSLESCA